MVDLIFPACKNYIVDKYYRLFAFFSEYTIGMANLVNIVNANGEKMTDTYVVESNDTLW